MCVHGTTRSGLQLGRTLSLDLKVTIVGLSPTTAVRLFQPGMMLTKNECQNMVFLYALEFVAVIGSGSGECCI